MNDNAAVHPPGFLADPTRYMFFTGKGGVGKTSIACAAALALADGGKSVLLVSTDPASNLDEILDVPLGNPLRRPIRIIPTRSRRSDRRLRHHSHSKRRCARRALTSGRSRFC